MGLNEVGHRERAPLNIELKPELLGAYAPAVDCANVTHRRDGKSGIKRGQVLLGGTLSQLHEAALPARAVVIFGFQSFGVCVLQEVNHGKSLGADTSVLNPNEGVTVQLVEFCDLYF